jgi:predicted nucleic acid-binding protein
MTDSLPVVVADTSALIAFFNETDKHHHAVREGIARAGHLVVSPCVLTELDHLIATRQGAPAAGAILRNVASRVAAGRWEVPGIGPLLLAAHAVLQDYPAIGLADAMNVVLARGSVPMSSLPLTTGTFALSGLSSGTAPSGDCQMTCDSRYPDTRTADAAVGMSRRKSVRFVRWRRSAGAAGR